MAENGVLHIHMNGGVGKTSYAYNCLLQRKVILKVKALLNESLKGMLHYTNFRSSLKVADLGCSSGPNSLLVISEITKIIDHTIKSVNCYESPTLQFFLNDLFGNDFNTIFKLLPNFYQMMQQERGKDSSCFINATPGNFYGRLFPNNYINLFHSSYSLHWLSQAPKNLSKGSKPLNKGNIYIANTSPPEVYRAYFEQFERDFKVFLTSRSQELEHNGIMVLTFIGRGKSHETSCPSPWTILGIVLNDMVLESLVEEKKLDFFNLPLYGPTIEEVEHVIETEGSFTLQTLKSTKIGWDANIEEDVDDSYVLNINTRAEHATKTIRAVFEPLLEVEFGKEIMDELFCRFSKKVAQLMETETLEYTNIIVSMTKSVKGGQSS